MTGLGRLFLGDTVGALSAVGRRRALLLAEAGLHGEPLGRRHLRHAVAALHALAQRRHLADFAALVLLHRGLHAGLARLAHGDGLGLRRLGDLRAFLRAAVQLAALELAHDLGNLGCALSRALGRAALGVAAHGVATDIAAHGVLRAGGVLEPLHVTYLSSHESAPSSRRSS